MPHQHDLAVVIVHRFDGDLKAALQLLHRRRRRRRQFRIAQLPDQFHGRAVESLRGHIGLLAIHTPLATGAMPPMGVDDPVARHLPQPQMKRHRRIFQVGPQPPVGFDHHFLHDVAGIQPLLNPPVQPHVDHPPQRIAVAVQ